MVSNVYDLRMYGSSKTKIYEACYIFATSKNAWIEKSALGKYVSFNLLPYSATIVK